MGSSPSPSPNLSTVLELARPFLRGELENIDPNLPSLIAVLKSVGAGECWHKHGSFLDHLIDIYKILKLWKAPEPVCLCGLFHSAYSNSYVNLAIFHPEKVSLATDFVYNYFSRDVVASVGYDYILRQSRVRGKIDSNGVTSALLEERLSMGLNFLLSAEVDHKKKDYKFGFGLTVG
ncbi:hypothetical protein F2Q70_00036925 [Brassica cretica]|uniref:DUF6817 domain-containing protein n=1 Tax=Brassica cretica TaxID=69181 RepID=A0A8S9K0F1_BRACR|nr:hypothetical protein F2Q70_00036925 [Brassica cretica]